MAVQIKNVNGSAATAVRKQIPGFTYLIRVLMESRKSAQRVHSVEIPPDLKKHLKEARLPTSPLTATLKRGQIFIHFQCEAV